MAGLSASGGLKVSKFACLFVNPDISRSGKIALYVNVMLTQNKKEERHEDPQHQWNI
jgi:hypothetical protein